MQSDTQSSLRIAGNLLKLIQAKPAVESQSLLQVLVAKGTQEPATAEEQATIQQLFADLEAGL